MRRLKISLVCILALAFSLVAVEAQEGFTSETDEYTLELPSQTWKATPRPDNVHQHTEFIYGDRMDGHLRIRKEVVDANTTAAQLAERQQDLKLRYLSGYVGGKEERFAGRLNGVTFSYEFTSSGKAMAGRIYYLQADNRTVYVLHFTGLRDKLVRIQNQTDAIARSFRLK
ncbi:MAG TPA: hypothetical protein VM934_10190 [Pyrinomonadaceae bacterium]|jgi:hypothetical protein|nr:hypothetical protein [Pyrinomonadaceae bacterium]